MLVIDTSVVIKWFIEEKDSAKAALLKDKHINGKTILIAPDLLAYEAANVLIFSKIFSPVEINRCLEDLYALEIDFISPSIDLLSIAAEFAIHKHLSIYDASYLALAKELDIRLVTADEKFFNSCKELKCVDLLSHL